MEEKSKKDIIKSWLKERHNLVFLGIIILTILIGAYYFSLTKTQPLWWDESDYLAYAKNLAGYNVDWIVTKDHNSLFSYVVAIFFMLRFSETLTKFFVEFIPYVLVIVLVYLVARSMYKDKRIALISSLLFAVQWTVLFTAMRFQVEIPGLLFGMLSIYVFWKGYEKKEKIFGLINHNWAVPIAAVLSIITYSMRRGYFLFGAFLFLQMIISKNWKSLVKDKYNWIAAVISVLLIFIVEKFIFSAGIASVAGGYAHFDRAINFYPLQIFNLFFSNAGLGWASILLYLFWLGLIVILFKTIFSLGHIKKESNTELKSDIFVITSIIITLLFFILVLREPDKANFGEPRWYFPLLLGALICISKATTTISDYVIKYSSKYGKQIAAVLIIVLVGFGAYYEISSANSIIKNKIPSFEGIKQASLYLKDNANENDIILSVPEPQTEYYSEKHVINPNKWGYWERYNIPFEPFLDAIRNDTNVKYLLVSFSEPNHPEWMKKVAYANVNGQTVVASWEIPFMDTKVDFLNNIQDVKQSKSYGDLTFNLVGVKQDVFIYKIVRN
ncbi:glycosyltransferase family 39 protein [Candidatus Pacearchaeota archaeon]|nr:glycosyltransferase family 39 protein [Candidatus Pacearchaeota archaeon]